MAPNLRRLRVDTRPLRHREFRNLWLGQAVSTLGGAIGTVAIPYQVYALTHSTALVGLLGLAELIPLLVVPLIGGAIADALDRRTVLIRTEVGMAGMPSALFPAIALHRLGGDASTVGYLYAAPYAGALLGSLLSGWTSHVRRQGLAVTICATPDHLRGRLRGIGGRARLAHLASVLRRLRRRALHRRLHRHGARATLFPAV
jgi:hypothetical protein